MIISEINYPSASHRNYIDAVYNFCKSNEFPMILMGSLAKGTATKYSDIDLLILGDITDSQIDELITIYGNPIMTNFTGNPKGIMILVYEDNTSIDLDIRGTISQKDLEDSSIILKYDTNLILSNDTILRKQIKSEYMPDRPEWYKILRLLHRGIIKYLSNKTNDAYELLSEIKDSLIKIEITGLRFNNEFENDIQCIFNRFCKEFEVDSKIKLLFGNLLKDFSNNVSK